MGNRQLCVLLTSPGTSCQPAPPPHALDLFLAVPNASADKITLVLQRGLRHRRHRKTDLQVKSPSFPGTGFRFHKTLNSSTLQVPKKPWALCTRVSCQHAKRDCQQNDRSTFRLRAEGGDFQGSHSLRHPVEEGHGRR